MPLVAGRYRLGESLGQGGMGKVWRARDVVLERDVAVKEILLPDELGQAQLRTLREARAAARLGHPNVVQIFDVFEVDGRTWIVMEYVPSRSLQEVLRADGPMDPRRVARIGLDLLSALRAAHAAGVDHRDVKPANVLLADDGRVLLTDFGIATIEGDSLISSSDMLLGSPEYMSPERAKYGTAGLAADLWSLGATLYAAVEGRSPFHRSNALATLTALAADDPDPPQQAGPLEPVLLGLLRKDPVERPDAAAVEHQLRAAVAGAYGHALVPVRDSATTTSEVPPPARVNATPAPVPVPPAPARADDAAPGTVAAGGAQPGTVFADDAQPGAATADDAPDRTAPADHAADDLASAPAATPPSAGRETSVGPSQPASSPFIPAQRSAPPDPPPSAPSPAEPPRTPGASASVPAAPAAVRGGGPAAAVSGARPAAARRWIVAGSAVAAVLLAAVIWAVTRPDTGGTPQGSGAPTATSSTRAAAPGEPQASSPASSAPATTRPQSSPPANAAPPDDASNGKNLPTLPDGWRDYRDSTGFAVYVPEGWTRTREEGMVYFRKGSQVLGIDQTDKPAPNPVADWRGKAEYRVSIGNFPAYREIHIKEVDYFVKAADWEFTFTRNGVRQHVNNRGLITSPSQAYGIYWQTRDADWDRHRDDLQLVFDSFRPAT